MSLYLIQELVCQKTLRRIYFEHDPLKDRNFRKINSSINSLVDKLRGKTIGSTFDDSFEIIESVYNDSFYKSLSSNIMEKFVIGVTPFLYGKPDSSKILVDPQSRKNIIQESLDPKGFEEANSNIYSKKIFY